MKMGHEVQYILESKRLVWLVAVVFATIMMFQYFEFPYGDFAPSLFSTSRAQPPVSETSQAETLSETLLNIDGLNYTNSVDTLQKGNNVSIGNDIQSKFNKETDDSTLKEKDSGAESPSPTSTPINNSVIAPSTVLDNITYKADKNAPNSVPDFKEPVTSQNPTAIAPSMVLDDNTSKPNINAPISNPVFKEPVTSATKPAVSAVDTVLKKPEMGDVVTMSNMHDILLYNRATVRSMKPLWSLPVDQELLDAKMQIENAPVNEKDRALYPPLYRNVSQFKRSYELMEKILKVYIYKEGEKPIFHQPQPVLSGIYASEGWFMKHMKESKSFLTNNHKEAHLFYLPFSSRMLEEKLYVKGSGSRDNLVQHLKDYLHLIGGRYDSWNRTGGSDHFLVACHDWATDETRLSMDTCIRALCNSDVKREGFQLGKDVSLVETYIQSPQNPLREIGGKPASKRSILAFFAGQMHGDVRPVLLKHWLNKDPDMKIFGKLPKSKGNKNYINYMKTSKYCICPKGYEVNSPRVVEAIFHECVPVIISDNFVPPFFEILNWESFAVFVLEKDIPNLKSILLSISNRRYLVMQQRVKRVQQHFLWHVKPVKYDIFHMILHSIWYNRVFRANAIS